MILFFINLINELINIYIFFPNKKYNNYRYCNRDKFPITGGINPDKFDNLLFKIIK